jgi:hypothetical protein
VVGIKSHDCVPRMSGVAVGLEMGDGFQFQGVDLAAGVLVAQKHGMGSCEELLSQNLPNEIFFPSFQTGALNVSPPFLPSRLYPSFSKCCSILQCSFFKLALLGSGMLKS